MIPPDRQPPRLPLSMLSAAELEDAAIFYRDFAADIEDADIEWTRKLAGDEAAADMERMRASCRQEAIVCDALAHFDACLISDEASGPQRTRRVGWDH
jgi:hypothetical protein